MYWLFPRNTIERGLYILGLPAKRFDVASTDFATLVNEAMDLMQHCRKVTYDEAMQQLKDRFRKETKWYSSLALQKSSSAILGIYCENNEFCIDIFSAKKFKGLKYIAELGNEQFPAAWFGKDRVIPRPETIFDYILELKMFFDKRSVQVRNKPLDFWLEMIRDISETIGADKGYFRDASENVMLYRFGNLSQKDIRF